jgi:hypothetical protein
MRRDGRFAWRPLRVRAVRGLEHRCIVFTPWERALPSLQEGTRACRRFNHYFRSSAAAITAGPLLAMPTVVPTPTADSPVAVAFNWHCWVMRRAASSCSTGSAVEEARHSVQVAVRLFARRNRRAGYMTCGPASFALVHRMWSKPKGRIVAVWLDACHMAVHPFDHRFLRRWESACNRGAVTCLACGGSPFSCFGSACMTCGTQPPCRRGRTLEYVSGDFARDAKGCK